MAAGQPKPAFYVALALVVLGLIGFAVYRSDVVAPKPAEPQAGRRQEEAEGRQRHDRAQGPGTRASPPSRPTRTTPTTVKEYNFKPAEKLPPVKGIAAYKPLDKTDNTVRFALNVWAGWAPIVLANDGFKAGKEWKTADGKPFKVDLVLIDNPVKMRDAYAAGEVHIGWAHARHGAPLPRELRRCAGQSQGKPDHAADLPAGRLLQRRRRHRGPREHQDGRRPAGQEDGAGPELALALLRAEHAGRRRRAAVGSADGLHRGRLPGRGRVQRPERTSPPASRGRRTSTTWRRPRATGCS